MAERTSFLNSTDPGFNKDSDMTFVAEYMYQAGIFFSDIDTKPEFDLSTGQVSAGRAVVQCTRTTGVFTGYKIMAQYEATSAVTIDTSGNKKVYIEIPESFVNDSTLITAILTSGQNLGVGLIKSTTNYPSHDNYIPLWEITSGDIPSAVDVRPAFVPRGIPDSVMYFDAAGKGNYIPLSSGTINKFFKSNGPGVAPEFDDISAGLVVALTQSSFYAGETMADATAFGTEQIPTFAEATVATNIGDTSGRQKDYIKIHSDSTGTLTWKAGIAEFGSPADNMTFRLETISAGLPTGTLVAGTSAVSISGAGLTTSSVLTTIFNGVTVPVDTTMFVVVSRSGSVSGANYYKIFGIAETSIAYPMANYDGASWNALAFKVHHEGSGFVDNMKVKAGGGRKIRYEGMTTGSTSYGVAFVGATTGETDGFTGLIPGLAYYLDESSAGAIILTGMGQFVGVSSRSNSILISKSNIQYRCIGSQTATSSVSVPSNSTATLKMDLSVGDGNGAADINAANKRWICPESGTYRFVPTIKCSTSNDTAPIDAELSMKKNGSTDYAISRSPRPKAAYASSLDCNMYMTGSLVLALSKGDYMEVNLVGNSTTGGYTMTINGTTATSTNKYSSNLYIEKL